MQQRRMGRTGLKVSNICLGTMTFAGQADEATSRKILDQAFEQGVTFIDTADAYPIPPEPETAGFTEEVIGGWLAAERGRRDGLVLATKCRMRVGHGPNDQGLSRRHILTACDASLRRLRTDHIDLYHAHSPDPETPIDETLARIRRPGPFRQGSLRRLLELSRLAASPGAGHQRPARTRPLRLPPAKVQHPPPRHRDRTAPTVSRPGNRRRRLQPAGRRLSHGQAQGRCAACAGHAVHAGSCR